MFKWMAWLMLGLLVAVPAQAEWRQARTSHFILTINDSEEGARDFAMRLERFDAALRKLYNVAASDQHSRPITIYAFKPDLYEATCRCPGILGYYRARAEGSYIMSLHMPALDRKAKQGGMSSRVLLLHEYTHHFTFANFPIAYPFWFQEGFAEFNANSSFEDDGSIIIGYPANYRGDGLLNGGGDSMPMKQLLAPNLYGYDDADLLYGRGWLLTHYLILNPQRSGQLAAYLAAMNSGLSSMDAAQKAFGDLKKLDKELDAYRKRALFPPLRIPAGAPITVTVTTLSPGQAAMLPTYALSLDGVYKGKRPGLAATAEKIAKRYPGDAIVQSQAAELAYLAERYDLADAAADRALAIDPKMVAALTRKGQVAVSRASLGKVTDQAVWATARAWYLKANRADPDEVMPLYLYYASFVAAKAKPTPGAIKGLQRAMVLAPESADITMALARQTLKDGDTAFARRLLQPIAFAPHAPRDKNVPLDVINLIDAGKIDEANAMLVEKSDSDKK